jgi:RNA polymerase sigma factor (sigma-70 family)
MEKNKIISKSNEYDKFNYYWENYKDIIFKKVVYITGNKEVAEDITQDVYIKLLNKPPIHKEIKAWLLRVAINLSYNFLRSKKIQINKKSDLANLDENIISIEDVAIKNYEIRKIKKILETLKPKEKMCLLLKFSGYSYTEISETLDIKKNSVGQNIARAQKKFSEKYKKEV